MSDIYPTILTVSSSIIFFVLAMYARHYLKSPGGTPFFIAMLLFSSLGVFSFFELLVSGLEAKIIFRNLQQIPLLITPVLIYSSVLEFIGRNTKTVFKQSIGLSLPIIVYWILIFTDQWHHLIRNQITVVPYGQFEQTSVDPTPLSILFLLYARLIAILSIGMLIAQLKHVSILNRRQYYILILAAMIPFITTWIPDSAAIKVNTAIASIPMALLYFYALFKYKFLRVHPVANDKIIEHIKEGIVVVDYNDIITQMNPAATTILSRLTHSKEQVKAGVRFPKLVAQTTNLLSFYLQQNEQEKELLLGNHYYNVARIKVAFSKKNQGALIIFTDITDRKRYEAYLVRRANIDGLTDLYNRQYIQEICERLLAENKEIVFLLLDIDYFKTINDTYGHPFGDQVLKRFSLCLRSVVKDKGVVGRIGGEEFAVLLSNVSINEAIKVADELQREIRSLYIWNKGEQESIRLTASIGMAANHSEELLYTSLFKRADEALYQAKNQGRNQIVVHN